MAVSVRFNVPRRELAQEGYRQFRHSPSFKTAKRISEGTTEGGQTGIDAWKQAEYDDCWRHPATGALTVRPSGLRADLFESTAYAAGKLAATDWRYNSSQWKAIEYQEWQGVPGAFQGFTPLQTSKTSTLSAITVSPAMTAWKAQVSTPLIWTHELNSMLTQNSGFGIVVQPSGISYQRGSGLMMVGFGDRFVLELSTSGVAKLWAYKGSNWFQLGTVDYGAGGVKTSNPVQVNVVVSGCYLTILVSDITQSAKGAQGASGRAPRKDISHTFDIRDIFPEIGWNGAFGGFENVIPPAPLVVGCRPINYHVVWTAYRNVYPTDDVSCILMPENLITKKEQGGLTLNSLGIKSDEPYGSGLPWYMIQAMAPSGVTTWTPSHVIAPIKVTMRASVDRSPELWGYGIRIPEVTVVPTWTPIDHSANVLRVIFRRSLDLDASTADIRLALDNEPRDIYRLFGPVEIKVGETRVWEGYVSQRRPTIEGAEASLITDQIQCQGIEARLADSPAGFELIGGMTLRDAIYHLFEAAGISNDDVVFDSADTWLDDPIPAPQGQEQDKAWSVDTSVADALRAISETYGVQDRSALQITYRPSDQKWVVKTKTAYSPSSPPTRRFWAATPPAYATETARLTAGQFKVFEPIELTVLPPVYNALRLTVASSTAEDTKGLGVVVDVDPDSVNDPDSTDFCGRMKQKVMQSPKTMSLTTLAEAERFARFLIDQFSTRSISATWTGEYQSNIDIGDEVALIGQIMEDDVTKAVSFGAFRITEFETEIIYDSGTEFSYRAQYQGEYLGRADYEDAESLELLGE